MLRIRAFLLACALFVTASAARADWCADGLEALEGDICHLDGGRHESGRRTLVIFLHGLVDDGADWQHQQQKGFALAAKRFKFAMIAPRGRNGAGPKRRADQVGWPTSEEARKGLEDELLASWDKAKKTLEARQGAPFDEVFVMGFSNGAYYASSLALRGKLDVDGYAVFAGGSAFKGAERIAKATKNRRPVFVAIASKDQTAKDGKSLAKLLKSLGWPHETSSRKVGHAVADAQLEKAVAYLRKKASAPAAEGSKKKRGKKKPASSG